MESGLARNRLNRRHRSRPESSSANGMGIISFSDSEARAQLVAEALEDVESEEGDGADPNKPYIFQDKMRESSLVAGFRNLYETRLLFDVTLTVGEKSFPCHRAFLAASSEYFRCMFTTDLAERDMTNISISGVDAKSMELVLKYLYTGQVELTSEVVQSLLSCANLYQLWDLKDGCADFIERKIDYENCIGIHFFAQAHGCRDLELQAWNVIIESFEAVTESPEFLELTSDNLLEVIKYDDIQASEEEVFEAVVRWFDHKPEERSQHINLIMQFVRFWLLDEHYIFDKVKTCPLVQSEPQIKAVVDEVIQYKLLKDRWIETDLYVEPRYGADYCRVNVYTAYLDDEKKQVLQLFGQRSSDILRCSNNVLCDLPNDLENPALLVTGDNDLYIAGGDTFGNAVNLFYKWSPEDGVFDDLPLMPVSRKQFCLVQLERYIYAVGGCNTDGNLCSVSRYHEDSDDWENVCPMPKALRCFCAVPFRGKMYVFGGESEKFNKKSKVRGKRELNRNAMCYDPKEDKWTVLAEMNTARALAGCTVFKNKIYVVGGFGTLSDSWLKEKTPENCLSSVEIFDPETNSWTMGPELPVRLCAMGVVKYYGTIYVLGGENEDDVSNSVYFLNHDENRWDLKSEEMISGVTETTIHSSFATINLDMDLE